jgi:hypothetical protein
MDGVMVVDMRIRLGRYGDGGYCFLVDRLAMT